MDIHSVWTAVTKNLASYWRFVWRGKPEEADKPVAHWYHFLVLGVAGYYVARWYWFKAPLPNKAVLALATVAALMLLAEMRPIHKALYIVVIILLVFMENRAIDSDRNKFEHDQTDARKEQNEKFGKIVDGLRDSLRISQEQFAETMSRSNQIIAGVQDTIKTQTGGNSFAFITFTAQQAQAFDTHWNSLLVPRGTAYFLVSVNSHGKYPLGGIHAIMMDDERRLMAMQEYNKHPNGDWITAINSSDTEYRIPYLRAQSNEAPQGDVQMIGIYSMPEGDSKRLTIQFAAPNGYWNEVLHLGRTNGVWRQCLSVMGPTAKQAIKPFIYCDSEWPEGKALAEKDWTVSKRHP